jgi:hypothetical protein
MEDVSPTYYFVQESLRVLSPSEHPLFLRELLAVAAAAILLKEGREAAAEAVYQMADAVVTAPLEAQP